MIKSKTKTGLSVMIGAQQGQVRAEIDHPQAGQIIAIGHWGELEGQEGIVDCYVKFGNEYKNICVTIPKADYDNVLADHEAEEQKEADDRKEKALAEMPEGHVLAQQNWSNGDLMSAEYETEDGIKLLDSDLLENHHGWYFVETGKVEEARQDETNKKAEKDAKEKVEKERRDDIFATAKKTGEKQQLKRWTTESCTENLTDCSFDIAVEWALPNGESKITYTHAY